MLISRINSAIKEGGFTTAEKGVSMAINWCFVKLSYVCITKFLHTSLFQDLLSREWNSFDYKIGWLKEHFVKRQREPLETDLEEVTARDAGLCRQENYLTVLSENQNLKFFLR